MRKTSVQSPESDKQRIAGSRLTSARGEKISAIEGMHLTPRMEMVLRETKDLPGEARRAAIKAKFSSKPA